MGGGDTFATLFLAASAAAGAGAGVVDVSSAMAMVIGSVTASGIGGLKRQMLGRQASRRLDVSATEDVLSEVHTQGSASSARRPGERDWQLTQVRPRCRVTLMYRWMCEKLSSKLAATWQCSLIASYYEGRVQIYRSPRGWRKGCCSSIGYTANVRADDKTAGAVMSRLDRRDAFEAGWPRRGARGERVVQPRLKAG